LHEIAKIMGKWENGEMGKWENGEMGEWGNGRMGKWGNGRMGKWENVTASLSLEGRSFIRIYSWGSLFYLSF
jgi:hypothetical protein